MKRVLLVLLLIVVALIVGGYVFVNKAYNHSYNEEFPVEEITINADSAMITHGKYLALGPAHCAHCHSTLDNIEALERGEEVPMHGGFAFELPFGNIYSRNITSDVETGIGGYSDGEIYRMMRHNIRPNGRVCIDFMPFFNMSEYDVRSVIAYLRTLEPIRNEVPENQPNFLGKVILGLAIKPSMPKGTPPEFVKRDSTIEYGEYLAFSVANCYGCHTNRDLQTGQFIGEPYAGGFKIGPDASTGNWTFVSPNLTPDAETGVMANWSEEQFIERMRGGRVHRTSPMPWGPFSRLDDSDLKAIYRFLRTVEPVKQDNGVAAIAPTEEGA
ncbi:MAG: cytochrome C [Flavobacteriales bacterium]|nr:cytochrome C [Flavobacteriales bacterium]